jgi:hypothetical protein
MYGEPADRRIAKLNVAAVEVLLDLFPGEGAARDVTFILGIIKVGTDSHVLVHLDPGAPAKGPAGVERRGSTAVEVGER